MDDDQFVALKRIHEENCSNFTNRADGLIAKLPILNKNIDSDILVHPLLIVEFHSLRSWQIANVGNLELEKHHLEARVRTDSRIHAATKSMRITVTEATDDAVVSAYHKSVEQMLVEAKRYLAEATGLLEACTYRGDILRAFLPQRAES